MKRLYTILSRVMLGLLLLVCLISTFDQDASYSASERRKLKTQPRMSVSALLDGSYFRDYGAYFADTFPGREGLKAVNTALNGFYYFGGLGDDGALILDFSSNGASGGEALDDGKPEDIPQQTEPTQAPEKLGSVLLVADSAFDVPIADREQILAYADAVTSISELLGEDVQTFSMPVPNSAEFYTHAEYHTGAASQRDMFELCRDNLGETVTYVDAYPALASHTSEYLYFRTDHHWTHLGAYYAYTALCDATGVEPVARESLEQGQWTGFVGSMYTYAADYPQARVLKENPDTVYYWKPAVDYSCYYYSDTTLSDPYPIGVISGVGEGVPNKYLTFMGGDHPVTIVETDVEGPCILVIKESYGNAIISWLTHHYSRIILLDPREYFKGNKEIDLASFAREQGVDRCLVINYPMMLNSEGYIGHLENLTK